tara:strand:- start:574 stop:1269 length:696 start_codon:yes stop_codon:yes gene_type:complete
MNRKIIITGSSRGIGKYLRDYYLESGDIVFGCSRGDLDFHHKNYYHFSLDISDEKSVKKMFNKIRTKFHSIDILINNAGVASMNHSLLTRVNTLNNIIKTNFIGTFIFCREAAKIMQKSKFGRIINFSTVAVPLNLEGEAVYASSKAAVVSLTKILSKEFSSFGITVNAIGPTPVKTDLIKSVPESKIKNLIDMQSLKRFGDYKDISNVIDFFIAEESDFITGQILYLGGI